MSSSHHKIGLGPKILSRARLVLGLLLGLTVILIIAGIYQGIQSGEFEKVFVKPFKQFAADFKKAMESTPAPSPLATLTPLPTSASKSSSTSTTKVIINQTIPQAPKSQPVTPSCIRKNIREGEFAGNKCYSQQDYEDLEYYLGRFNSAVFSLESAEASMRITCSGSDFFKDSCERDKQKKGQAESDISKYRSIIQGIIAKGK